MAHALNAYLAHPPSPPFIYLHHPHHPSTSLPLPRPTAHSSSTTAGTSTNAEAGRDNRVAQIDVVEYSTPRLLLSGIHHRLTGELGEVSTFDALSVKLRAWWQARKGDSKGKAKARAAPTLKNGETQTQMPLENGHVIREDTNQVVLVITRAERLRLVLGPGWSVITRLSELTGVPCSVVLCSTAPWDNVRPHRADAPEPVHVYLPPPSREEILSALLPGSSHPLYPRFLELLLSTILPLVTPPIPELHYLSLSLWPIYTATLPPHLEMTLLNLPYPDVSNPPPALNISIKLLTDLKSQLSLSLAAAIESLLPRQIGSAEFVQALKPGSLPAPGSLGLGGKRQLPKLPSLELPLVAKFVLVAAYAGSYNPPKSDVRLFGRGTGPDGKRKKGGGTRRTGYGRTRIGKVPQRLLGPKPFPLDRLLALLSSLYAEHAPRPDDLLSSFAESSEDEDEDDEWAAGAGAGAAVRAARQVAKVERRRKRERERENKWDIEVESLVMGTKVWSLIPELESQGLIRRTSPPDRLDNITLRCEIEYETAKTLAKELKITLDEYLYEAI